MPLDPFFTSKWKSKPKLSQVMAAKHRRSWPAGGQYKGRIKVDMRGGEHPDWWTAFAVAEEWEIKAWADENPGYEFRKSGSD